MTVPIFVVTSTPGWDLFTVPKEVIEKSRIKSKANAREVRAYMHSIALCIVFSK